MNIRINRNSRTFTVLTFPTFTPEKKNVLVNIIEDMQSTTDQIYFFAARDCRCDRRTDRRNKGALGLLL